MDQKPLVSVIIISYNTRDITLGCLRALFAELETVAGGAEVWVVDNASRDGSAAAVRGNYPAVRLVENSHNLGFGAANNVAMREASGEFFLLLNSDAFVRYDFEDGSRLEGGAISVLVDYLRNHPNVAIVGPRLLNADGSLQPSCWKFPSPLRAWLENTGLTAALRGVAPPLSSLGDPLRWAHDSEARIDFVSGACFLMRREIFEQTGGFDEKFHFYAEETDWQRRLRGLGWQIAFTPAARVVHLGGASGANAEASELRLAARESSFAGLDRYTLKHHGLLGFVSMRAATALGNGFRALIWWVLCLLFRLKASASRRSIALGKARLHSWLFWRQLTRWKLPDH